MICDRNSLSAVQGQLKGQDLYGQAADFVEAFSRAGTPSVDLFLEHNPKFNEIGKLCIARALIALEFESRLIKLDKPPSEERAYWYEYIFDVMSDCSFEEFGENEITFLTFNYDRSLDHYLHTVLMNKYDKTSEEAAIQLEGKIIHLHGQIGYLPWQSNGVITYDYDTTIDKGVASDEVLSNVVDGKRAHPTNSGCLLDLAISNDDWTRCCTWLSLCMLWLPLHPAQ